MSELVPEMVDRVAKALESQLDIAEMVMADPMTLRRLKAKRLARVAIEAMREPTKPMVASGTQGRKAVDSILAEPNTVGTWRGMIDAALSSPAPTEEG